MVNTDLFLEKLCGIDVACKVEISELETEFSCRISIDTEKHNQLQYTHYYEVDFNKEECFFVEIENGINNGTVLISAEWGISTKKSTKIVEVLKDVVFDEEAFGKWYEKMYQGHQKENKEFSIRKGKAILNSYKSELLDLHRKQNYDNYVTGGGTNKTDKHYQSKFDKISDLGVFWKYIYEEREVDCNFL